jgi:hypothetical protein
MSMKKPNKLPHPKQWDIKDSEYRMQESAEDRLIALLAFIEL